MNLYVRELTGNFGFKFMQRLTRVEELIVFRSLPNSIASN